MRNTIILAALLASTGCAQGQKEHPITQNVPVDTNKSIIENMDSDYSPTFAKAHPNAKRLMKDEFFFSVIEETAPFGSDDGADAYAGFKDWRPMHSSVSPVKFLHDQIESWKYPLFDLHETSYEKLKPYLEESFTGKRLMRGIDAAIVATAFGQLYLEGTIDNDIKELAKLSVKRELLPEILKSWEELADVRQMKLNKLLKVLNEVK
jgi:uncharacterized protein YfeS